MQKKHCFFRIIVIFGLIACFLSLSCKRDRINSNGNAYLSFSDNLILFDTVFTTVGSVTQMFRVRNPYKSVLKTNIALIGGSTSFFSVNVDGASGTMFREIEIPPQDSIFIFVKVNINPNGGNVPLLITDTLAFFTNGNRQNVELIAFGEDAHFIVPDRTIQLGSSQLHYKIVAAEGEHITWTNEKPYVIYGCAVVDSTAKLTINPGTQIYLHKNGILWVYKGGCLHVNGTKDHEVVFQGDRRAFAYSNDYAQWDRIWINEGSQDNIINYAVIKNAYIGIQAEIMNRSMGNKLILTNTLIKCSQKIGFLGRSYSVEAYNNVIADCREFCLLLAQGGNYTFSNNTIYNHYSSSGRTTPSAFFSNYYEVSDGSQIIRYMGDFKCDFTNNIVYGNASTEFGCSKTNEVDFKLNVENCLLKIKSDILSELTFYSALILNQDPLIRESLKYDFHLQDNSPCKSAGKNIPQPTQDITGTVRNNPPSIGAYE
ncbi:MAG: hypothetical protein LBQ64_01120 [Bacteroidales bacterium]|nr:hypothetical protein [Bacteroidales bacterium]